MLTLWSNGLVNAMLLSTLMLTYGNAGSSFVTMFLNVRLTINVN